MDLKNLVIEAQSLAYEITEATKYGRQCHVEVDEGDESIVMRDHVSNRVLFVAHDITSLHRRARNHLPPIGG